MWFLFSKNEQCKFYDFRGSFVLIESEDINKAKAFIDEVFGYIADDIEIDRGCEYCENNC